MESIGNKRATFSPLHLIQGSIGSMKEGLGGSAFLGPGRDTETDGDRRLFAVRRQQRGYSPCNQAAASSSGSGKDQSELIAAVARNGVDAAGMNTQDVCKTKEGASTDKMTMDVIDLLQVIHIHQHESEAVLPSLRRV